MAPQLSGLSCRLLGRYGWVYFARWSLYFLKSFFKFLRLGSALVFVFVSQGRGWSGKLAAGSQSLWPKIPVNLCIVLLCVYTVAEEG